jgi:broad specificity phosphatase PhoE
MTTTVHLLRHGEVHNPQGILYGRASGFHLSERGLAMADRVAERVGDRDITRIVSSPLERAQQTAAPLAAVRGLEVDIDERLIESDNFFAGKPFSVRNGLLLNPAAWPRLWNPFTPSWGEPYTHLAARMWAAVEDARDTVPGHEAVLVSHQLPIWITRLYAERKRFVHNPRRRQCTLCSITSFEFDGDRLVRVTYSEPAGDLIPVADRRDPFSSGGAPGTAR